MLVRVQSTARREPGTIQNLQYLEVCYKPRVYRTIILNKGNRRLTKVESIAPHLRET